MLGERILNYRITRIIGEGGIATVYEGKHVTFGRKVAIKVLKPQFTYTDGLIKRFENSTRIMASLQHPNIIEVLDYYEDDASRSYAIVMELLEGENLSEFIKRQGKLTEELAYDLMIKILNAFEYAHNRGLVHRDVKPGNIFITPDKNIKILDFDISKIIDESPDMTETGMYMGTPLYMSPEQIKDPKRIDKRSDIYSLGVMFFYMLTGNTPFDASSLSRRTIEDKIIKDTLPVEGISEPFASAITKATAKDLNNRYQTCEEFLINIKGSTEHNVTDVNNAISNIVTKEQTYWERVRYINAIGYYQEYLRKYSDGKYILEAKEMIRHIKEIQYSNEK